MSKMWEVDPETRSKVTPSSLSLATCCAPSANPMSTSIQNTTVRQLRRTLLTIARIRSSWKSRKKTATTHASTAMPRALNGYVHHHRYPANLMAAPYHHPPWALKSGR